MEIDKTIEGLNTLIIINNDRIQGYNTAAKETEEFDLKTLFAKFTETSHRCKQELVGEVTRLGGKAAESTMISGKFFRVWMDVKAALTGRDRKAILSSCEYGEDNAIDTYKKVLHDNHSDLSEKQQSMINEQLISIKADHDKVKFMRDALVEV